MSVVALAWEQFRFERKLFWRNPSAAFFNFLLPLLLLVLIATAFASEDDELEILIPGVAAAAEIHGTQRMKPVFTELNGEVSYDAIRIVFACLEAQSGSGGDGVRQ